MSHIITLLTDFGNCDGYVAQMKGVILGIAPNCQIVDASHAIAPQDIRAGALALRDYSVFYPDGTVHVAVVDPGVGTARRIVAASIRGQKFVLPDNGLLGMLIADFGVDQAVAVEDRQYWRDSVSHTFHGRDIMAPVAAHLVLGLPLERLGTPAGALVPLPIVPALIDDRSAWCEVLVVDRFGNVITNLPGDWLQAACSPNGRVSITLEARSDQFTASAVATYGQMGEGALVVLVGSQGRVELAVVGGSAAAKLGIKAGERIGFQVE